MKTTKAKLGRRNFLLAVGAGTAAAGAAIVSKTNPEGASSRDGSSDAKKGYQLSEHVRNYYRTAKI